MNVRDRESDHRHHDQFTLIVASDRGSVEAVRFLLKNDFDIDIHHHPSNLFVLHLAVIKKHYPVV